MSDETSGAAGAKYGFPHAAGSAMPVPPAAADETHDVLVTEAAARMAHSGLDVEHIATVPAGEELTEFAVYFDLNMPEHGPCVALAGQTAGSGNRYVAKADVDPELWDRIIRTGGDVALAEQAEFEETHGVAATH